MLQVTGIAFALYHVTEVARARQFYEGILGLKVCAESEFGPGQWWIEYDAGGPSGLAITNFGGTPVPAAGGPGVAIEVTNYDEALAAVQAAGIVISWGPHDCAVCRSAGFRDPDGNELFLHQRKPSR
ncbi:MAG TPA: VOC family protein [Lacunisphaera sp.]|nr:VOC family protein [Lacunisphaera sp.]